MKKKMNLTAIIAVAMVAMSVLVLGSCNADDGYNEFDYGTLAKGLATRSGEGNNNQYTPQFLEIKAGADTIYHDLGGDVIFEVVIAWDKGIWATINPTISVSFKDGIEENDNYKYEYYYSQVNWVGYSAVEYRIMYKRLNKTTNSYTIISGEYSTHVGIEYASDDDEEDDDDDNTGNTTNGNSDNDSTVIITNHDD